MATFIAGHDQRFPAGTVLKAYPATGTGLPKSVTPDATATVATDSTTTFTGLDEGERYVAGTTPNGPFLSFSVPAVEVDEATVSSVVNMIYDDDLETYIPSGYAMQMFAGPVFPPDIGFSMRSGDAWDPTEEVL